MLLVKISFDGNNKITPQCVMDEKDCIKIANDANIQFESSIDIFYNKHFEFEKNESNMEATNQLKLFCPRPSEGKVKENSKVSLGIKWNYNFA